MFDASDYWITVVELEEFDEAASTCLSQTEIEGLVTYVAVHPHEGEVIPDTGGLRVISWPACTDSAPKVIYFFRDLNMPVYLVTVLSADESLEFTASDKAKMRVKVDEIIDSQWTSQISPIVAAAMKSSA